jgi:multidrug resistance efflux pump
MPEYDTRKPRKWTRVLGVFLATGVGISSLIIVLMTQEPKKAISSPVPARAAVVPQIADAKSEAEILFRGKSFSTLKRVLSMPYAGEITKLNVQDGQAVEKDQVLAEYKLDRQSMIQVQRILYPETVLTLKRNQYDRKVSIDKLRNGTLPIKKLEIERLEKELLDLRELRNKGMAYDESIKNKDRQLQAAKKEFFEVEETIHQQEADLAKISEDLKFYEDKQRRDIDLLEWQTNRTFTDQNTPANVAYLKAPIPGNVIVIAPEMQVKAEVQSGFPAMTVAPTNPMTIRCKVHELDLVKLKMGDRGSATFDAIPDKKYPCKISKIPWVSRNSALEVPADYDLECELDNSDGKIKDGLTCNVKISVTE